MARVGQVVDAIRAHPGYAALVAYLLAYFSWQAFRWLPGEQALAGDAAFLPISGASVYVAWLASRRTAASPRLRRAWLWFMAVVAVQFLGDVSQLVYEHATETVPYPGIWDLFYLGFYPLMLMAVVSFPSMRRSPRQALELALDCAIVGLGGGALFIFFVLGSEAVTGATPLEAAVTIAYPVGDMILLVALGAAVLGGPVPEVRNSLGWLIGGMAVFVLADLVYGYIELHGAYEGGDPVDILYILGYAAFLIAPAEQRAVTRPEGPAPRLAEMGGFSLLPYVAVAACLAILLIEEFGHPFLPDFGVTLFAALVTVLLVARQLVSLARARRGQQRLEQAQAMARLGSWEWDVENDRMDLSPEAARILHLDEGRVMTRAEVLETIHPNDRHTVEQLLDASLDSGEPFSVELRAMRPDGDMRTLAAMAEVDRRSGRPVRVRGSYQDVTDRKRMEVQLRRQADHDPLTGLYNRNRFTAELDRILRYASRYDRSGAMLMLDVDDFKFFNDARGHAAGDALLKRIAGAIAERARETDVYARLGADEFAIVLPEAGEEQALTVAEDIRRAVAEAESEEASHLSVGIAPFDGGEVVPEDVLTAADVALYEAKEAGKDQVRVYHGKAGASLTWVQRIRGALAEERLVLYAQPMIDLRSGHETHRELLIRMLGDDGEVIPPEAFMPTAERFGLSNRIDRWVLGEGLELARRGQRVSINVSAPSIGDEEILTAVREAISRGALPAFLIFEITETAAMRNMEAARKFTEALDSLGCSVALDDFGTGFGSFTYLKHLPTRYLKIDMEFVRDVVSNATDREVVRSITEVAHSLGKRTIAEGVESAEILRVLRDYGVDWGQGFFIGRPERITPPTAFERRRAETVEYS